MDSFDWICYRCSLHELPFADCSGINSSLSSSLDDSSISNGSTTCTNSPIFLSSDSSIHIAHLNVRSLLSVIDDIHCLLINENIDILAISESWLDKNI